MKGLTFLRKALMAILIIPPGSLTERSVLAISCLAFVSGKRKLRRFELDRRKLPIAKTGLSEEVC